MIIKKFFVGCLVILSSAVAYGQDIYRTKTGNVNFIALQHQNAHASSHSAEVTLNSKTNELNILIPVNSFEFKRQMMLNGFNRKVMQTDKFPNATFTGTIPDVSVNLQKDGDYTVSLHGKLTLHGITRDLTTTAFFSVRKESVSAKSVFVVLLDDYSIINPGVGDGKITITVQCDLTASKM
jgi:polyisoprenoid-binding protein YceI